MATLARYFFLFYLSIYASLRLTLEANRNGNAVHIETIWRPMSLELVMVMVESGWIMSAQEDQLRRM